MWALAVVLAIGSGVRTNLTHEKRQLERDLRSEVRSGDRYVDLGVILRVVVADRAGDELIEGKPRLRVIREHRLGGLLDTSAAPPRIVGPSRSPRIWFCSEDQEPIILHSDSGPLGQLVYGSEGAGKTTALAMWHYVRWLEHLGEDREGGQTAPNKRRLKMIRDEIVRIFPREWYEHRKADDVFLLCDGSRLQLIHTHQQSGEAGSPVQGFNWSWAGGDEAQDSIARHADIQMRGRSAKNKRYKQCRTATAKDTTEWRDFRSKLLNDKAVDNRGIALWVKRTLLGRRSPFVDQAWWDEQRYQMSEREYLRRVEAQDVGPERQTYHSWNRERNLIRIPEIGFRDVTERELAKWGARFGRLVGHDPGSLFDVSIPLRAFDLHPKQLPIWIVVDEITTEQTTTEEHVAEFLRRMRDDHGMNLLDRRGMVSNDNSRCLVRADPYGNNDAKPDRSCYTIFRNEGVTIHPAVYAPDGTKPGRVPKDAGIELVNTLLCNAAGESRLFVALNDRGQPVAPNLVKALETSERDEKGRAETQKKDENDLSHWPAALRYALWAIERPRIKLRAAGQQA